MAPDRLEIAACDHMDGTMPMADGDALAAALAADAMAVDLILEQQLIDRVLRERPRQALDSAAILARIGSGPTFSDRVMDQLAVGAGRRPRPRSRRTPRSSPSLLRWTMAALVLLAVGAGGWWWMQGTAVAEAEITATDPGVTVIRGTEILFADCGFALRVDDRLRCPAGATATVAYADGSRLILTGASGDFGAGHTGVAAGKGLLLTAGSVEAVISPQPAGLPFVIATPQARVTVIGTRFTAVMAGDVTRLAVEKGRVRFDRLSDHSMVEVGAGESAEAPAQAPAIAVTTLSTLADAYVRGGDQAMANFGTESFLDTKNDGPGYARKAFLKFDLSGVRGPIMGATLRLFGGSNEPAPLTVVVHGVADTSWTEATITWNNQPAIAATVLASVVVPAATKGWYSCDLTTYIQSERTAGRTIVCVALENLEKSQHGGCGFSSKEARGNQPELVVTAGPVLALPIVK